VPMVHIDGYVVAVKDPATGEFKSVPLLTTNLGSARKSAKQHAENHAAEVYIFEIGRAIVHIDEKGTEHDLADSE
jgi:mannose-6-phosphate isomerase-like protein (cupin superfamily)